jgi:hypothetical protein
MEAENCKKIYQEIAKYYIEHVFQAFLSIFWVDALLSKVGSVSFVKKCVC